VSKTVKDRSRAAGGARPVKDRSGRGLPPKAERRALGKLAAQKRARAKRRKRILQRAGTALSGVAVLVLLLWIFGVFDGSPATEPQASASPEPTATRSFAQLPPDADPALFQKPVVTAGEGEVTELKVTTLIEGSGPAVENGHRVFVNYVGVNYATGEEFDSSWDDDGPYDFIIGQNLVIKGWEEGLLGVTVGSRVQLDIPAEMAYPHETSGPTAGALRFVVDVISVQ